MEGLNQRINWLAISGHIGRLLHVPGVMALITLPIALIFEEWYAFIPFATLGVVSLIIGQLLYHTTKGAKPLHLWDAMIVAGAGWLTCSLIAATPFIWISSTLLKEGVQSPLLDIFQHPSNAFFESFSGFTSTGLTMLQEKGFFPHVLDWWRSLLEWVGGLGLLVFVLAITQLNNKGFPLYYAEARSDTMQKNMNDTLRWIWIIYCSYTLIGFGLFALLGMPIWEAVNHSLTVISNGGFTTSASSFKNYSKAIQSAALLMMVIGAISFTVHYRLIKERYFRILWENLQHRLLFIFLIAGGLLMIALNLWNGLRGHEFSGVFEWVSAFSTCGFTALDYGLLPQMSKLFLIIGMFIGATAGSTSGGLKIKRLIQLASSVMVRIRSVTEKEEKYTVKMSHGKDEEPPGVYLPHSKKNERLFTASVLFSLWISTLFLGWFCILRWTPKGKALDALFEVTSAMSNVGLSSSLLTPDFSTLGKVIFMLLMWMGRLEMIPALILLLSLPLSLKKR